MDLAGVMKLIKAEASRKLPLHSRRMQLLKVRKTGTHSDFLQQLKRMTAVLEWDIMTVDDVLIHLFSEQLCLGRLRRFWLVQSFCGSSSQKDSRDRNLILVFLK